MVCQIMTNHFSFTAILQDILSKSDSENDGMVNEKSEIEAEEKAVK